MKSGDVIKRLKTEGWKLTRTKGSHQQWVKGDKRVTVPHPKKDLPKGTLSNIFKQAGWE